MNTVQCEDASAHDPVVSIRISLLLQRSSSGPFRSAARACQWGVLAACWILASVAVPAAQPIHPNFEGTWALDEPTYTALFSNKGGAGGGLGGTVAYSVRDDAPLKGEYAEKYWAWTRAAEEGHPFANPVGAFCLPQGMPRMMLSATFEVLQRPERVTMLFQMFGQTRRIYTDGRAHPAPDDFDPSFAGHSIGHWEDDTLIVDTVGLTTTSTLDLTGVPHSDETHIIERFKLVNPSVLEDKLIVEDPKAFTHPWATVKHYKRLAHYDFSEEVCDNNRNAATPDGHLGLGAADSHSGP